MLPTLGGSHLAKDIYHYALAMVQNRGVRFISSLKGVVSVSGEREQLGGCYENPCHHPCLENTCPAFCENTCYRKFTKPPAVEPKS